MLSDVIWSAWVGGVAVGVYIIAQLLWTNKALGCSTPFGNVCSLVSKKSFFHTSTFKSASASTNLWFLGGILIGGFISAYDINGTVSFTTMNMGVHYDTFLPSTDWLKALALTAGGILIGLGARMANGCTSGHAMSGISMLNPVNFLATALFFIGGALVVNLMNIFLGGGI